MKKLIALILVLCSLLVFTSCSTLSGILDSLDTPGFNTDGDDVIGGNVGDNNGDVTNDNNGNGSNDNSDDNTDDNVGDNNGDNTDNGNNSDDNNGGNTGDNTNDNAGDNTGDSGNEQKHLYLDFTSSDKALFNTYIGVVVPFIPNDEYYIEGYYDTNDYEHGINFYTYGNTEEEFRDYLNKFTGYILEETYEDYYGDTWYCYVKDDVVIDVSYYYYEGDYVVDLFVYSDLSTDIEDDDNGNTGGGSTNTPSDTEHLYDNFTNDEFDFIFDTLGISLPFIPNDEYYVEEYEYENEIGLNFYTFGNTEAEFSKYLEKFSGYTYDGSDVDEYGDTWYFYSVGELYIDVSYYYYEGDYVVDLYAYFDGENSGDNGNTGGGSTNTPSDTEHLYDNFTDSEIEFIIDSIGITLPFIPNDEYYVEEYEYENEIGLNFYTFGNTEAEFSKYLEKFSGYTYDGSDVDEYGDTWYFYSLGDLYIDVSYYYYDGDYVVDLYAYFDGENSGDNGNTGGGSTNTPSDTEHLYDNFTDDEFDFIFDTLGIPLPFIPNDEYYVEEYEYENEIGLNFYAFGNTEEEFLEYLDKFYLYTYDGSDVDEYGDTWYFYSVGDLYIDVSYYYYDGDYIVDLYAYFIIEGGDDNGNTGDSGNTGGGSGSNPAPDVDLITNNGAGLPDADNGVHNVDFTKAENVKDVTDQGYYLDGCPTTGSPAVLVIPVEFKDVTAASKGYSTDVLKNAFYKNGATDYYSVYDYYFISSYGQLELDITVLDEWFRPQNSSSYYYDATYNYYGDNVAIGDQLVLNEALAYLEGKMDLSKFDSDGNGIIDAVVLINTLDVGEEDFYWAYRYWNIYTDNDGYYYEYDGVSANDYIWASYQFIHESYDARGEAIYTDHSVMNTYTFIHEFAHVLGVDDYYDTAYVGAPMSDCDIMDSMLGDHNAYTKFNLGWITTSRLVVADSTITLKLEAFAKNGDTIIIANNWDDKLGAYQEYYVLVYYTNTELNANGGGYFQRDGIVVYHVNASLYKEIYGGETYYDVYNNNTDPSDSYGTYDNLIEFVKSAADTFTYVEGDTLPTVYDDAGNKLLYTFTVDELTETEATITFTAT